MITATFLVQQLSLQWPEARELSRSVYIESDRKLTLERCIAPKPGFPAIFQRLYSAGIPYGIATSDNYQRASMSVAMYDDAAHLSFIVTPEDVVCNKPAPHMLQHISRTTGVSVSDMMVIGDSYVDMEMARCVNAIGVGIPETEAMRQKMQPFADEIVDSLDRIQILS